MSMTNLEDYEFVDVTLEMNISEEQGIENEFDFVDYQTDGDETFHESEYKESINDFGKNGEKDMILQNVKYETSKHRKHRSSYKTERQNRKNESKVESVKSFLCDECDYVTNKNWNFILHQRNVHDKVSNVCSYCNKEFIYLKHHIETKHENPESYKCEYCDKIISRLHRLKFHIRQMHTNPAVKLTCPVCFKRCLDIDNHIQQVHVKPKSKDKKEKCDDCDYSSASKSNLWSHIATHHKVVTWTCPECSKEMNKQNKYCHMKKHKAKSYVCSPCDKTFLNRLALIRHILYSHKKHRNKCDYCKKDTTNLKFHAQANHKELDSSNIDISRDVLMIHNIKIILGVTRVYNGELDELSLEKIENWITLPAHEDLLEIASGGDGVNEVDINTTKMTGEEFNVAAVLDTGLENEELEGMELDENEDPDVSVPLVKEKLFI